MKFYPETFLSNWHIITISLTVIALIGMIVGGYSKRTIIKSTLVSFIAFYAAVTILVAFSTGDAKMMEEEMIAGLDSTYEFNKESVANEHLVVFVGSFEDDEGDYEVKVYAGNYNGSTMFEGDLRVVILGENGDVLDNKTYEDIALEPGAKIEIDSYFSTEVPDQFKYMFEKE